MKPQEAKLKSPNAIILSAVVLSFEFCLLSFAFPAPALAGATAADTWAQVTKTIAIMPGTTVSVWKDATRSLVTNGTMTCTAVGDGTYEAVVGLVAGQTYNYIFYANAPSPAPGGLVAFNEYYDVIPNSGQIRASTNGKTYNDTTSCYYSSVNFDARRVIKVPTTLNPGDTLWVFNNFGETPVSFRGLSAQPEGDTQVRLYWTGIYGSWGAGGEAFKCADVLAGGTIEIYRTNTNESNPYTKIATIGGEKTTYLDTNLPANDTYFYVLRARDAYTGSAGAIDTFPQLRSDSSTPVHSQTSNQIQAFFIVRDADWDVIQSKNGRCYLSYADDVPWGEKMEGSMVRVYLPPRKTEQ